MERGGLRFLQKRYAEAARDLQDALRVKDDPYVRELLGSTLLLAARPEEALTAWNGLGRPRLAQIEIKGLAHTQDGVARRELVPREGEVLATDDFRETRLRLEETGVFDRVRLRVLPTAPGEVHLEVDLAERHGFGPLPEILARGAVDVARRRVRAHYDNVLGAGLRVSGEYKWERTQPTLALGLDMPRPFGLPANVHLEARRSRPQYDLDGPDGESPFTLRTRGLEGSLRRVLTSRNVVEVGFLVRTRTFDVSRDDTLPGRISGLSVRLDRRLRETWRHRVDGSIRGFQTLASLGSEIDYSLARVRVASSLHLRPPEPVPVQKSELAAQVNWGWGSDGMPLDQMFAPGAASEIEFPLRAYRQKRNGILGRAPLARSLALLNLELRQRILNRKDLQAGAVAFYDAARIARSATGVDEHLHGIGLGLRLGFRRAVLLRIDYGYSLTDGNNALTGGIGQAF